ncbi:hypothetical protein HPQ64_09940 [Rhizobiales bacterium]|uniref:hypothetical protein n=1 Tax=Hongsoonwoonella zoysiae TaxID=2821844 RepID=UPI0015609938|nr:hypothetical protein [Hongsoonwoonella zoysiae]NRG18008.1 hypothetical protein [Hongsoonwoonella zoysiae]
MDFSAARPPLIPLAAPVAREPAAPSTPSSATALPASQAVPVSQKVEKPANNTKPRRDSERRRGEHKNGSGQSGSDDQRQPPPQPDAGLITRPDDPQPHSPGETLLQLQRAFLKATQMELTGLGIDKTL